MDKHRHRISEGIQYCSPQGWSGGAGWYSEKRVMQGVMKEEEANSPPPPPPPSPSPFRSESWKRFVSETFKTSFQAQVPLFGPPIRGCGYRSTLNQVSESALVNPQEKRQNNPGQKSKITKVRYRYRCNCEVKRRVFSTKPVVCGHLNSAVRGGTFHIFLFLGGGGGGS